LTKDGSCSYFSLREEKDAGDKNGAGVVPPHISRHGGPNSASVPKNQTQAIESPHLKAPFPTEAEAHFKDFCGQKSSLSTISPVPKFTFTNLQKICVCVCK